MAATNGISVDERLTRLEEEVRHIRKTLERFSDDRKPWWRSIIGTHENDPDFAEIVRLGREIREKDLVPVWRKRARKKSKKGKRKASLKE